MGLSSLISLSSSLTSSLGCLWGGGSQQNVRLTGLLCPPAPWSSAPSSSSPCTGGLEYCGPAHRVPACSKVGTVACGGAGALGPGLQEDSLMPHTFPHSHSSVSLLVVAWRTPAMWIVSRMVTICCVFTALHWNSTSASTICCLRTLFSFNSIQLHSLSISYTAKVLPGVILHGSLVYKYIFLGVIPVDETISVSYI